MAFLVILQREKDNDLTKGADVWFVRNSKWNSKLRKVIQ